MRVLICGWLVLASSTVCLAQARLTGRDRFPQFRGLSGLGCSGYGLDAQGRSSLSGPVGLSVPVAYTLGDDQARISAGSIGSSGDIGSMLHGADFSVVGDYGHSFGRVNVSVSDLVLSSALDQAFNIQAEIVPTGAAPLAAAIGVQDVTGTGGSAGEGEASDSRTSRSFFATVTTRVGGEESPAYVTAGGGTRRFEHGFAAVSVRVARPLRFWAEWDGLGANLGVLLAGYVRPGRRPVEIDALAGIVDGRYATAAVTIGF